MFNYVGYVVKDNDTIINNQIHVMGYKDNKKIMFQFNGKVYERAIKFDGEFYFSFNGKKNYFKTRV